MSIEYMENTDSADIQSAKNDYVNYVVYLEDQIEEAEKSGSKGDTKMFLILDEIENADTELAYYARAAHEMAPMKNYATSVERLKMKYLPLIMARQIENLENDIKKGGSPEDISGQIAELKNLIDFYDKEYPELNLTNWKSKLAGMEAVR